jgi:hypothetical protein
MRSVSCSEINAFLARVKEVRADEISDACEAAVRELIAASGKKATVTRKSTAEIEIKSEVSAGTGTLVKAHHGKCEMNYRHRGGTALNRRTSHD